MSLAIVYSRAGIGIEAPLVTVEVHLSNGLPSLSIVGLPEAAVKESKDRVRSAIINSNFDFPARRITINLAPADLPKEGGRFDLPIALGILAASGQVNSDFLNRYEFVGELALTGELRSIKGILPISLACQEAKRTLIVPASNAEEAGLIPKASAKQANHLLQVCELLNQQAELASCPPPSHLSGHHYSVDIADVIAQDAAKRALLIAASGHHHLVFVGPPGTGKSMLAHRLPTILSPMNEQEAKESAAIYSVSHFGFDARSFFQRKIRTPHHSCSAPALIGGGSHPKPGEISLSHRGVLFLDEFTEFDRFVLDNLREPMESGKVTISRAASQMEYPAQFLLVAAMNPCPCGHFGNPKSHCRCTPDQIRRYLGKISGPLLDRIDLQVEVPLLTEEQLTQGNPANSPTSQDFQQQVLDCQLLQQDRQNKLNAELAANELEQFANLSKDAQELMSLSLKQLNLSARSYHRIIKVARTIADLARSANIEPQHISETLGYRKLERYLAQLP
ncbi:MAG: YifB family Mg chelatase-like AAA ATPase [Gammaproteobacteria bacterium]|nr:YifB family Mg chelatase-like AAA ATPase [Gammaproteobacteria bacterium]